MDIQSVLNKLAIKRPIFHSEADFQHELAWLIHQEYPNAQIRLEIPSGIGDATEHIDLVVTIDTLKIAIELKYKKTKINTEVNGEIFNLKPDTSHDTSRYDYLKDVRRIEEFICRNPGAIGYAIMLTNVDIFWREMKPGQNSEDFFLHQGRKIQKDISMKWHSKASEGTLAGRNKELTLTRDYEINWQDYSLLGEENKSRFKYLVIKTE